MRKTAVIILVLSLTLTITLINLAYADSENNTNELMDMHHLNDKFFGAYFDGFNSEDDITTAEFATLINSFLNLDEVGNTYFDDLNGNEWFFYQARIAKNYNYIESENFNGYSSVTYNQAIRMLSNITGIDVKPDVLSFFNISENNSILNRNLPKDKALLVIDCVLGYTIDKQSDLNSLPENIGNISITSPNIVLENLNLQKILFIAPNAVNSTVIRNCTVAKKIVIPECTSKHAVINTPEQIVVDNIMVPLASINAADIQITYFLRKLGFGKTFLSTMGIPNTVNNEITKVRTNIPPEIIYSSISNSNTIKIVFDKALHSLNIDDTSGFLLMDGDTNKKLQIVDGHVNSNFLYLVIIEDLPRNKNLYLSYNNYFNNYRLTDKDDPNNVVEDFEDFKINYN